MKKSIKILFVVGLFTFSSCSDEPETTQTTESVPNNQFMEFEYGDIEIARALMNLQRFGITARHLRGIKSAADRDLGLIQGVVNTVKKQRDPAAKSRAAAYAAEIESQFAVIRAELIRAVIDKID